MQNQLPLFLWGGLALLPMDVVAESSICSGLKEAPRHLNISYAPTKGLGFRV